MHPFTDSASASRQPQQSCERLFSVGCRIQGFFPISHMFRCPVLSKPLPSPDDVSFSPCVSPLR